MHKIEVDKQLKIIRYSHQGSIPRQDLGMAWMELLQMDEFVKFGYNLLTDYRQGSFNFEFQETDEIWEFLVSIKNILQGKKEAVITDEPYSTAVSLFFEDRVREEINFNVKVFSTEEAAVHWLLR